MNLHALLTALGMARGVRKAAEAYVKEAEAPHKAAAKAASAALRPLLEQAKTDEAMLAGQALDAYQLAEHARVTAILAGEERPAIPLPEGCTVRLLKDFQVTALTDVPLEFLTVDRELVKTALEAGENVPGVRKILRPSFSFSTKGR